MKKLFIVIMIVLMTGCVPVKPDVVVKEKVVYKTIPSTLTLACNVTTPPDIISYVKSTNQVKEDTLTKYTNSLLNDLNVCNKQLNSIKDWDIQQSKIYTNE